MTKCERPNEQGWYSVENGATIGRRGSENGKIVHDLEHELGARITLERDCSNGVPMAVTCGIYGWFFHTRLIGSEAEAQFAEMADDLDAILGLIPSTDDPEVQSKASRVSEAIGDFVNRFP